MSFLNFNFSAIRKQDAAVTIELPLQARAINVLNIFRFILSLNFIALYLFISNETWLDKNTAPLFFNLSVAYFVFSIVALLSLIHI